MVSTDEHYRKPLAHGIPGSIYGPRRPRALGRFLCNSCVIRRRKPENDMDGSGYGGIAYEVEILGRIAVRDVPRNEAAETANPRTAVRFRFRPPGEAAPESPDALIPGSSVGRASGC